MKVLYSSTGGSPFKDAGTGVGLGNFDGLHIGHMALVNTLISEAKLTGLKTVIYNFKKHPENILRKRLFTPLITTENKKIELLEQTPLDYIYFDEFDESFSRTKPEAFVKDTIMGRLNAKLVIVGFDYRFGYRGQGDTQLLKDLGRKYGFKVVVIPPVKIENEIVSSTSIRNYIVKGDMDRVFKLLGRHFSLSGEVEKGRRIGNTIGFPTANLIPEDYLVLPHKGVYITKAFLRKGWYSGVTNIGLNPTFKELDRISVETHIMDFEGDIYGEDMEVFFLQKIRGEKKFENKEELIKQINKDVLCAQNYFT